MAESKPTIVVDQTYHFDEHKRLVASDIPDAVAAVTEEIDHAYAKDPQAYFQRIIDAAQPARQPGEPPYMVVRDKESSDQAALVITLPYGNPVLPDMKNAFMVARAVTEKNKKAFDSNTWNNPIKHVYLFDVIKALGVRDEQGKTLPVITIGADSQDYQPKLNRTERRELWQGLLRVYRRNVELVLDYENIGQAHVAGYSQGASVAHSVAAEANNIDMLSCLVAEPSTYKDRPILALARNYLLNQPAPKNRSGIKSTEKWTESGPQARKELEDIQNRAISTMAATIVKRTAWRTAIALSHGTMVDDLKVAADNRGVFPLTIAWNETSSLTHDIETTLFNPQNEPAQQVLQRFKEAGKLRLVKAVGHEAVGAPHLAGESPMFYSLLIGESLAWATKIS